MQGTKSQPIKTHHLSQTGNPICELQSFFFFLPFFASSLMKTRWATVKSVNSARSNEVYQIGYEFQLYMLGRSQPLLKLRVKHRQMRR